jgi:hypothetical protein
MIREAEDKKRDLEKKVAEIEQASKQSKQSVEKEIKELETKLDKAGNAKNPNKDYMDSLRGQIGTKKDAISGGDKKTHEEIKDIKEKIKGIDTANKGRKRVEGALTGTIIPGFEAQHDGMHETLANLFSDGGEVKGVSFSGLQAIQGLGGTLDEVPNPPPYGVLGGEVFAVQDRLRTIKEEMERVPDVGAEGAESESATVAREMMEEWRKRYMVSQAQFKVLQGFPGVAATQVPFGGAYARGGVVAAEVGERGREIAVMPQGARVIPSHEAQAALMGGGGTNLNFEELNVYEDGTVTGRVNGEDFTTEFKKATKKIGGRPRTPGGR